MGGMKKLEISDEEKEFLQEFEGFEVTCYYDFRALVEYFGLENNAIALKSFIGSSLTSPNAFGAKLYLAVNLDLNDAGVFLVNEEDMRLIKVVKERIRRKNDGSSIIHLS